MDYLTLGKSSCTPPLSRSKNHLRIVTPTAAAPPLLRSKNHLRIVTPTAAAVAYRAHRLYAARAGLAKAGASWPVKPVPAAGPGRQARSALDPARGEWAANVPHPGRHPAPPRVTVWCTWSAHVSALKPIWVGYVLTGYGGWLWTQILRVCSTKVAYSEAPFLKNPLIRIYPRYI